MERYEMLDDHNHGIVQIQYDHRIVENVLLIHKLKS